MTQKLTKLFEQKKKLETRLSQITGEIKRTQGFCHHEYPQEVPHDDRHSFDSYISSNTCTKCGYTSSVIKVH